MKSTNLLSKTILIGPLTVIGVEMCVHIYIHQFMGVPLIAVALFTLANHNLREWVSFRYVTYFVVLLLGHCLAVLDDTWQS